MSLQATGLTIAQEDVLYDWIYQILNPFSVNIAWAYPDELQQEKPFCILNVPSKPRMEHKPTFEYVSSDNYAHRFHNAFTFSVNVYDDIGNDYIRRIIKSQYYDSIINLLKREGLACRYEAGSVFIPKIVSDRYEFRENVDFIMAYSELDYEVVGELRSIEISSTFENTIDLVDITKNWVI